MNREKLVKALRTALPFVCGRTYKAILECFHITDNAVMATDLEKSIKVELPEPSGVECLVQADRVFRLLDGLPDDDITLKVKDEQLIVKGLRVRGKFSTYDVADSPMAAMFNNDEWKPLPAGLLDAMNACRFCVGKMHDKYAVVGVRVFGSRAYATDGRRAVRMEVGTDTGADVILPVELIRLVLSVGGLDGWYIAENDVWFRGDGVVIRGNVVQGKFPNVDGIVDGALKFKHELKLPEGLSASVARHLANLGDLPDHDMDIEIKGNELLLSSRNEGVELDEKLTLVEKADTEFKFRVNSSLLLDAARRTSGVMKYKTDLSPDEKPMVAFVGEGYVQVMMLIGDPK